MGIGLLESANAAASLLPKEFADKGWRKVTLLIVLNLVVGAIVIVCVLKLLPGQPKLLYDLVKYPVIVAGFLDLAFFGYNYKNHKEVAKAITGLAGQMDSADLVAIRKRNEEGGGE